MLKHYNCPVCGKEFSAYQRRTTCSKSCQYKHRQRRITVNCAICGKLVTVTPKRIKRTKGLTCSIKCQRKYVGTIRLKQVELRDKNWCLEQYKTKSLKKIAEELGCGETTVFKYFKYHGIILDRRKWLLGVPKTLEQKNKLSILASKRIGELNPNWRNGITDFTRRIRASKKYLKWKSLVLANNKPICNFCGITKKLEVDHIKKFRFILLDYKITTMEQAINCKELWDIKNGRIVCRTCNMKLESIES